MNYKHKFRLQHQHNTGLKNHIQNIQKYLFHLLTLQFEHTMFIHNLHKKQEKTDNFNALNDT
jgi:hypothetical protein